MTLAEFKRSLSKSKPPTDLAPALAALWWAGKDDWDQAHKIVMDESGKDCAWVHAYLHRVEGDLDNARKYYRSLLLQNFDEKTAGVSKAEVYLMLGRMHVLANEIPKARNMFERGLEIEPANVDLKAALTGLG